MVYICTFGAINRLQQFNTPSLSTTMAANPRSATNFLPTLPKRAPTTQLSMSHPGSSLAGDPSTLSTVVLRPLHQVHGEAAAVGGKPIEYVSYVQETSESQVDETPEQKLIDPELTAGTKSIDKV